MPNETQDFLKQFEQDMSSDFLNETLNKEAPEKEEDAEEAPRNRKERRENKQLEWEREARIKAEAKLEALSEAKQFAQETGADEDLVRLYGADNKEAINLHQNLLAKTLKQAEENAIERMKSERIKEQEEVKKYEAYIDSEFENIEDEYDVDLTSNAPAAKKSRNDLIAMVQKLSAKDKEGNVTAYADFSAAYEILQSQKEKKDTTRNKDIASRGMASSGQADSGKLQDDAARRYLRSQGINV